MPGRSSSLLMLAIPAVLCSRTVFAFFDDPEGPNLLVVLALAVIIYLAAAGVYLSNLLPRLAGVKRFLAAIAVQIILSALICLMLR